MRHGLWWQGADVTVAHTRQQSMNSITRQSACCTATSGCYKLLQSLGDFHQNQNRSSLNTPAGPHAPQSRQAPALRSWLTMNPHSVGIRSIPKPQPNQLHDKSCCRCPSPKLAGAHRLSAASPTGQVGQEQHKPRANALPSTPETLHSPKGFSTLGRLPVSAVWPCLMSAC